MVGLGERGRVAARADSSGFHTLKKVGLLTAPMSLFGAVGATLLLALISLPLSFLVGAGSAGMALVMPILAPLGDFAGVGRSLIVTLYSAVGGWLSNMLPTNAILMASLVLAKVRFDTYIKWLWPLAAIVMGIILVVSVVGAFL